jgi:ribonuclease P protein component
MSGRRFHSGRALIGFAVASEGAESRIGVTVSRTIRGAVQRNRARRRLREVARASLGELILRCARWEYDMTWS